MDAELILITKEGEKVRVSKRIQNLSHFIRRIIEDFSGDIEINTTKEHLDWVLEYAEHHNYEVSMINKPIKGETAREMVDDPWDFDYLKRLESSCDLFDFIMTVNYLDVSGLMELLFGFIASKFKGKDINNIRERFKITEEYTEEEDRKIMKANPWAN